MDADDELTMQTILKINEIKKEKPKSEMRTNCSCAGRPLGTPKCSECQEEIERDASGSSEASSGHAFPEDWDVLFPDLASQWQQVAHELAELVLSINMEWNRTPEMRHYHGVSRRQEIASLREQVEALEKQNAQVPNKNASSNAHNSES